jgi:hypothetical protein
LGARCNAPKIGFCHVDKRSRGKRALAARLAAARKAMALLRQLVAALRIADLNRLSLFGRPDDPARWVEGLPKEPDCPNDLQLAQ